MINQPRVGCPLDLHEWAKANANWSGFCAIVLDQIERTGSVTQRDILGLNHLRMLDAMIKEKS